MTTQHRVSVDDHIWRLRGVLGPALEARKTRTYPIEAEGLVRCVSAEQLRSPLPLPGFDNSQMDGFAVRSQDIPSDSQASWSFPITAVVAAGTPPVDMTTGTTVAVMTGAPIPHGADVVIPVEKTTEGFAVLKELEAGEAADVEFTGLTDADTEPGRFIRPTGSAVAVDEVIVEHGQRLTPARLGLLAACGYRAIPVLEKLRTLVISTGLEIRAPGEPLEPGQLYDANTVLIRAVMETFGHTVDTVRISSDEPAAFLQELDRVLTQMKPHLVITAGGISAGAFEVVREALHNHDVDFSAIAQQPGGPQGWGSLPIVGHSHPAAFIGLPGNPVSCAVSLETLLRPALNALDPTCPKPSYIEVHLGETMTSPLGIRQFRRVRLSTTETATTAYPLGGPSSHLLGHYAQADALVELRETDQEVAAGAIRKAILLPGED